MLVQTCPVHPTTNNGAHIRALDPNVNVALFVGHGILDTLGKPEAFNHR